MLRKWLVPALVLTAALLVVSCKDERSTDMGFVTPEEDQRVPPGDVTVKVWWVTHLCSADSVVLDVDRQYIGTSINPSDTCTFVWNSRNVPLGTKPLLYAKLYYSYVENGQPKHDLNTVARGVLVDTGGPDVRIVSPQAGDTVGKGSVPIKVWARDTSIPGMDRVELLVDDALNGTAIDWGQDTWRYTWDASQASAGNHTVKAKAYNGFGEVAVASVGIWVRDSVSGGGPTHHGGYVDTSETWSPGGNPHIVDSSVTFRSNAWLTIEPGCVVKFEKGHLAFGLYGPSGLTAVGTAAAPVLFTSNRLSPARGDWTGVRFGSTTLSGTRLSYCTVEYAGVPGADAGAITLSGGCKVEEILIRA